MRLVILFGLPVLAAHLGLAQSDVKHPISTLVLTPHFPRNAVVQAVQLRDGHIRLAFSARSGGEQQVGVLRVNNDGSSRDIVPVSPGPIRSIFFDELGRLNALREHGTSTQLATYDSRGLVSSLLPASDIAMAGVAGSTRVMLRNDGAVLPTAANCRLQPDHIIGAGDLRQDVYVIGLDERTLAIVSKRKPKVAIVECVTGQSTLVTLKHPLIDESVGRHANIVKNFPHRGAGKLTEPLLFIDAVSDGKGNLLLALGSFVGHAAPLIAFDKNGKHLRTVHLKSPSLDEKKTAGNPEGLVVPRWFSVDNDTVAIASTDGVVSLYTIK